ncbi:MAG: potassium transporter KefB [Flavobacterium sp.]|nr:MAG: potassium transporter KefB [Flavobacterium sp.]
MLIGTAIGLIAISIFVFGAPHYNPDWGKYWRIKPLIITPLAGAFGGAFFHTLNILVENPAWRKAFAIIAGGIGFLIVLWVGIVLGLNGTMWD